MHSMRLRLRSLLLVLLALAVPLHGYAAAAMAACGMRHAQEAPAAVHATDAAMHEAPCHGDGQVQKQGACDACASCAALSVPAITAGTAGCSKVKTSFLRVPLAAQPAATHVPDGPERPPRTTSR